MRGNIGAHEIQEIFNSIDKEIDDMLLLDPYALYNAHDGVPIDAFSTLHIVLCGSAPLIYTKCITACTNDIDFVYCSSHKARNLLSRYYVNAQSLTYCDCLPYNYEDRLVNIYNGMHLQVNSMSVEDLMFMKLCRWEKNDIEDFADILANQNVNLDFLKFLLYDEEESRGAGMSDRQYSQLLYNYKDFTERFGVQQ